MALAPDRRRAKRTRFSTLADQLYPEDGPQESVTEPEEDAGDEQDGAGESPVKLLSQKEMAEKVYPEKRQDDPANQDQDESGETGQEDDDPDGQESRASASKAMKNADKPGEWHGVADAQSPVVKAFLQTNPLQNLPHGAVSPAPTMAEQSEREAQAFAVFLSKISKTECPLLEKDIGLEQGTISSLSQMVKEGKDFKDYGLTPHADDQGYVNTEIFSKKSYTYQRLLKLLESDTWKAFTDKVWVYTGAALTGNLNRPLAMREKERSERVLRGMIDTYDNLCKK